MKLFTLLTLSLTALSATANPMAEPEAEPEIIERRARCTPGLYNPNGPCTYNVTCQARGTSSATPLATRTLRTFNRCLNACTDYTAGDTNCGAVNYNSDTNACDLYGLAGFSGYTRNRLSRAATVYGCG